MNILQHTPSQPDKPLHNPYFASSLFQKISQSLAKHKTARIAFLDIDNTLTGSSTEDTNQVRAKLKSLGYAVCFVTARTEEALMSEDAYLQSKALGFSRPRPHLMHVDGKRKYADPRDCEPTGLIDPDVIAGSTGTNIFLRQESGGFTQDLDYREKLGICSEHFRESVLNFIRILNRNKKMCTVASIEDKENYKKGITDVFPSEFRVSVEFENINDKKLFAETLKSIKKGKNARIISRFLDHEIISKIKFTADGYGKVGKIRGYITPTYADKGASVDQILSMVEKYASIDRSQMELLFAGDAFPDLSMGLNAGLGTRAKFILVGGSRLSSYLTQQEIWDFAGEGLRVIKERLFPTAQQGYYSYTTDDSLSREVIIADLAYANTQGPQSILRFFQ